MSIIASSSPLIPLLLHAYKEEPQDCWKGTFYISEPDMPDLHIGELHRLARNLRGGMTCCNFLQGLQCSARASSSS